MIVIKLVYFSQEYHKTFCETLTALGYKGRTLTFEELVEEFNKSGPYSLLVTLVFLPTLYCSPDTDIAMFESSGEPANDTFYNDVGARDTLLEMIKYYEKLRAFEALFEISNSVAMVET